VVNKILVVDDNPGVLRFLEHTLTREGHQVLTATNGIEGLQIALREVPDLTILDVMLPGLDGFEVCHRLRSEAKTTRIPVLMLSAKEQTIDRDTGLKVGADEYLVKPVDRRQLLDAVQRLLARRETVEQTHARLIAFIGSRGGVGTSTVVTNTSVALAQKGYSVILVDLCPSLCMVPALMGLKPEHTIAELFKEVAGSFSRDDLEAALTRHATGVRLLSGEQAAEDASKVTPAGIEILLQELGAMADYILVDTPASPSEVTGASLGRCDLVNLVTGPEPGSLTRIGTIVTLLSRLGVNQKQLGIVVVDRTGIGANAELSTMTSIDGIPVMGVIPSDAEASANAETLGTPVVLAVPLSPVAVALRGLADKLLSLEQLTPSKKMNNEGSRSGHS